MIADTLAYLRSRRATILDALARLPELPAPAGGELSARSVERIVEFCSRGKMIRGCLVFLGAEAAGGASGLASGGGAGKPELASIAAAMELFQAGLLAHDDIMDRDLTRRGAPTIHAAYASEARRGGAVEAAADAERLGESLGICLGDLCYFQAYGLLGRATASAANAARILELCSEVLGEVAVAQMSDVAWGATSAEPSEAEILAMYRGKTARYSFSLPLAAGALAAGGEARAAGLSELGNELGILFQIRDDELGLFGSAGATGKGIGSDLREGKKTLFRARLLAAAAAAEAELPRLRELFGSGAAGKDPSAADLAYLRELSERLGVASSLRELSRAAEDRARGLIEGMDGLEPGARSVLEGLVEYVTRRDK